MIVNTSRLFAELLGQLRIGVVCDVGSMDGADALRFAAAAPQTRVFAFEPHPANFAAMHARRELFAARRVELVQLAASDRDGSGDFFLVESSGPGDPRRGMSSLHRRTDPVWPSCATSVAVRTTRLDSFLAGRCAAKERVALWIDTEGAAFETLQGARGMASRICMVHVEVETVPCIGAHQRLYPDVRALLERLGLEELATDRARRDPQFNALYIRREGAPGLSWRLVLRLLRARLRHLALRTAWALCPACVLRLRALLRGSGD